MVNINTAVINIHLNTKYSTKAINILFGQSQYSYDVSDQFALIKHFHLNEMHFFYIILCFIFSFALKSILLSRLSFRTARNVLKRREKTEKGRRSFSLDYICLQWKT